MKMNMKGLISVLILLAIVAAPAVTRATDLDVLGTMYLDRELDSLALAPNTATAYGTNSEAKTLYIFNLENYSVKKTIGLDRKPVSIAVNPITNIAYITARDDTKRGLLYVVDSEGVLSVNAIPRDPKGIAIDAERNLAVISLETDKQLLLLSLENLTVKKVINLPHRPAAVALDADSSRAVVLAGVAEGEGNQNTVLVVDLNTGDTLLSISLKNEIKSLSVDMGKDIAVAVSGKEIKLIDINTGDVLSTYTAGSAETVDINQSTHTAIISDKKEIILLNLTTLSAIRYSLNAELKPVAVDAFRNTALLSGKKEVLEVQLPNPRPEIENLMPKTSRAGEAGFTLSVLGNRFIASSAVQFKQTNLATVFKDNNSLEAEVPASLLDVPEAVPVTVINPAPEGGRSRPFYFTIKYPAPVLSLITPDTAPAHSAELQLKLAGNYFMPDYMVNFNGQDLVTAYINTGELQAVVPSPLLEQKGVYPVVVISPDKQNSNFRYFTVTDPVIDTFHITVSAGPNGSINCAPDLVPNGSDSTCSIIPADGYDIETLLVDGVPQSTAASSYTFHNVISDHTILASFADLTPPALLSVQLASANADPTLAIPGDTITVTFTTSEAITLPIVMTAGHAAVVSGEGVSWSATYMVESVIPEGPIDFSIDYSDLAGNGGSKVIATTDASSVTFDRTAPALLLSMLEDGSYTNNATLNITGTVTDNMGVQGLTINDQQVQIDNGIFSFASLLVPGDNAISIVATDLAGNTTTETRNIMLDMTSPTLTITAPADNSVTNVATADIIGTVDEDSIVIVRVNGGEDIPAVILSNNFNLQVSLEAGMQNTIDVYATDRAGNTTNGKRTVTYDNAVPALAVTDPPQDISTNQSEIIIQGTVSDLTTTTLSITDGENTFSPEVAGGTFAQPFSFSEEKPYAIVVTAVDAAGNTSNVTRNIIYDITPPSLTLDPLTTPTKLKSQTISGSMEAGAAALINCQSAKAGVVDYPTPTTWQADLTDMTEGINEIFVVATDAAGNTTSVSGQITLDTRHTVLAIAGANGAIAPSGSVLVEDNMTQEFTVTPNAHYHILSVTGCNGTLSGSTYTTGPITEDCQVNALFTPDTFLITTTAGPNGSVSCTPDPVPYGLDSACSITPADGYHTAILTVDGLQQVPVVSSYTFGNVTAVHSIAAAFSKDITFTPEEGRAGTVVIISGDNFNYPPVKVYFNGVEAVIQSVSPQAIVAVVPVGVTTGPVKVTTAIGSVASSRNFTVLSGQDFSMNISPSSISIPATGSASALINIQSIGTENFTGLVKLFAANLPTGVGVNFNPEYISLNQSSVLTITSTDLSSDTTVTIGGTATPEGIDVTRTAALTIEPVQAGTTTITGKVVASKDVKVISGVTLSISNLSVVTDEGGGFLFIDPPVGDQVIIIDGHTANTASSTYPSAIPVPITVIAGQNNTLPYYVYLHEVNTKYFTQINPLIDTIVTDPDIPYFQMTIPSGVQIIGQDGVANEKVSVKRVSRDRLPIPPPPDTLLVQTVYMFYFGKPGGGDPTSPIPVNVPNELGSEPGEKYDMYYYDESQFVDPNSNQWKTFGTGTVSDDGRQIVTDPGYGIPKFCCGAMYVVVRLRPATNPNGDCPVKGGEPVDLATGIYTFDKTDIAINGIIPIELKRTYRTLDYSGNQGGGYSPFGGGALDNYDTMLTVSSTNQRMAYILPDGGKYYFYKQSDGSFLNNDSQKMYGAKAYLNGNNTRSLRFKDGRVHNFNSGGMLTSIADSNGNKITITRQSGGLITTINDQSGRGISFSYNLNNHVSNVSDNIGRHVNYTYNSQGMLSTVTDPNGGRTTYTYDAERRLLTITDPLGITYLTNEYDSYGRVSRQTNADGGQYAFTYYAASTPVRVEQPVSITGTVCRYIIYLSEGEPAPSGARCVVYVNVPSSRVVPDESTATDSGSINQTIYTSPSGSSTVYRFDGQGYMLSITDGLGRQTSYERETGTNRLLSVTDPLGRKTSYTYDTNGNIATVTDPDRNVTTVKYELTYNKPTTIKDALGHITSMEYDSKGNLLKVTSAVGETTNIAYNSSGEPVSITDALGNVLTFEYDSYGNLITTIDQLGNKSRRQYDVISRLISLTDANGKQTGYTYDSLSRITTITDALNNIAKFSYDGNGNLLTVTDAKGRTTTYTYNGWNDVASMRDPLGKTEYYTYDFNRNLTGFKDRKGQQTTYTYDYLDRLTDVRYADGSSISYTYDGGGRLTTLEDSISGMIIRSYDTLDRLTNETTSFGSISFAYDAIERRTKMTVAGQPVVNYGYDANSRLIGLSTLNSQLGTLNFAIDYDALGRRTSLELPNGGMTSYSYDTASNLLNIESLNPLDQILEKITYAYDNNGNRTKMDRKNMPVKLPNPVTNTSYNAVNQMLTFNDKAITYDNNGNMTTVTNACGTTNYNWDARNRLAGINGFNADCLPLTASFKYDALGRRIEKTINGKTTDYLYDGFDIVQEIEDSTVSANYIRTLNIDEPLARSKSDGTIRYYQQDGLGSVIALTDETGAIRTQYNYEPFGNTNAIGEASDNPFQYAGRENDGTGLLFERNRYDSLEMNRYISPDPIGFAGGDVNYYVRVWNDPVNFADPEGLNPVAIGAVIGTAIEPGIGTVIGAGIGLGLGIIIGNEILKNKDDDEPSEHTKNARPSTKEKHEKGKKRKTIDKPGGEKGDSRRPYRCK